MPKTKLGLGREKGQSITLPPIFKQTLAGIGDREIRIKEKRQTEPHQSATTDIPSTSVITLESILGEGGQGSVWGATHSFPAGPGEWDNLKTKVAAKEVGAGGSAYDEERRKHLVREAHTTSQIKHDNIVSCMGLEWLPPEHSMESGRYFMVMPFIPGIDLDGFMALHDMDKVEEIIRTASIEGLTDREFQDQFARTPYKIARTRIKRIPDKLSGFVIWSVARGLKYAHDKDYGEKGKAVIHRDIKPPNIMIKSDEGCVKLLDFGIATTAQDLREGELPAGTLPYISPEALLQTQMDTRADLYSLGVVLYELMTGFRPNDSFEIGGTIVTNIARIMSVLERQLVPPHELVEGVDRTLSEIACRMLQTDPDKRYQTAAQVQADIAGNVIYIKGVGPSADGMRDYIEAFKDPEGVTGEMLENLSFLKRGRRSKLRDWLGVSKWFKTRTSCDYKLFTPYVLTDYAKERLAIGENPARL